MSRFEDTERFLDWQREELRKQQEDYDAQVAESRKKNGNLINATFEVFNDFYKTVVSPRLSTRVVRKQQEYPQLHPNHLLGWPKYGERIHYTYQASVIPSAESGLVHEPNNQIDTWFAKPGDITSFDWTPNVALLLSFELVTPYDQERRLYLPTLKPRIALHVWGIVPKDSTNSDSPMRIGIGYGNSWNRNHSGLFLSPSPDAAPLLEPGLTEAFKLASPRVLGYRAFWGK